MRVAAYWTRSIRERISTAAPICALLASTLAFTWGPEERLTTAGTVSETGLNHGALAVDSWGRVTAAWAEQDGPRNNFRIYTRAREVTGAWGPPELAVDYLPSYVGTGLGAKFPTLTYLAGDTLLMVWHDYRVAGIQNLELFTKLRPPGAAWGDSTSELRLTTSQHPETNGDNSYVPNVALDANGVAHVAWYDYRFDNDAGEILFKSRTGGAWDVTPGDAPDHNISVNTGDSQFAALAAAPDGSLHLAWRDNSDGSYRILYRERDAAGTWSAQVALSPPGVSADGATLAVASDGTVVAAWADARGGDKAVYTRERPAGGVWGAPRRVSPGGAGAEEPALAIDAEGRRHLAWQDARVSVFNREIFHQAIDAGSVWDSTGASDTRLSDGTGKSSRPSMLVDRAGRVFVLWQDARHGNPEMYFRAGQASTTATHDRPPASNVRAWPNPFAASVTLGAIPPGVRRVRVVDTAGRERSTLAAREGQVTWDGRDAFGRHLPAGVYFIFGWSDEGRSWTPLGRIVRSR
jgi:hypothetical protein